MLGSQSDPERDTLRAAIETFVRAGVAWLGAHGSPSDSLSLPHHEWTRTGDRTFVRQTGTRLRWSAPWRNQRNLVALPEYVDAAAALRADAVIGPQLDQLVGTRMQSRRMDSEVILISLLSGSIADNTLSFDGEAFQTGYLAAIQSLDARTFTSVTLAPIAGLANAPSIRFGDVTLDRLSDSEATVLLDAGYLQHWFGFGDVAFTTTEYVLRLSYEEPKVIGRSPEPEVPPVGDRPDASQLLLEILTVFRLFKKGAVTIPGVVTVHGGGGQMFGPLAPLPTIHGSDYTLDDNEASELVALWSNLRGPALKRRHFIQTAVRRFLYAGERTRVEDRFVDLMIAAEAMFLGEKRKGETTTELTHKIATRFAYFLAKDAPTRRKRFEHMKNAYGARSSIVHGDRPKNLKREQDLVAFTDTTAEYLRDALRAMIAWAHLNPTAKYLIDWDELVIGPRHR
jgi:hypothetical protein